jgi:hypothetical protein
MDPYDYSQYAAEYNYNNPYVQQQQQQQPQRQQPQQQQQQRVVQKAPPAVAGFSDQRLTNPWDENTRLREQLELLRRSEERAKVKVAVRRGCFFFLAFFCCFSLLAISFVCQTQIIRAIVGN